MFRSSPGVHQHPQTLTLRKAIGTNREKHPGARGGTAGILNHCHPNTTKNPQNPDTRASKASGAGVQKQPGLTPYRAQGITQSQVDGTQTMTSPCFHNGGSGATGNQTCWRADFSAVQGKNLRKLF